MKWANLLHNLIFPIMTSDHQEAFDKLTLALTTAPVLAYLDYMKPFVVETDDSLKGLGTLLSQ